MLNDESTQPNLRHVRLAKPPAWPLPDEPGKRPAGRGRQPFGWMHVAALGASAILLLSVLSLLSLLSLTSHAGLFSPSTSAAQSSPRASADPTHSSTALSGWLQIAPANVQFGCADHQRNQIVVLQNRGSRQVHWQASLATQANQSAVNVSPGDGDLGPGESTAIQLQSTTNSTGQQAAIRFEPTDQAAGSPATVTVTAVGCS